MFQTTPTNTTCEGLSRLLQMLVLFQQGMTSTASHIPSSQIQLPNKNIYNHQCHTIHAIVINQKIIYAWNNNIVNRKTIDPITTTLSTSRSQQNEQCRIKYVGNKKTEET
jgi:hypothetical protein